MKHAVFGKVVEGLDVVEKIAIGDKMTKVEVMSQSPHAAEAKQQAQAARVPE
jgi:cyclophilin family peptidyl-prolyl cis-trans isomerase